MNEPTRDIYHRIVAEWPWYSDRDRRIIALTIDGLGAGWLNPLHLRVDENLDEHLANLEWLAENAGRAPSGETHEDRIARLEGMAMHLKDRAVAMASCGKKVENLAVDLEERIGEIEERAREARER
jgi:hypothetical protein